MTTATSEYGAAISTYESARDAYQEARGRVLEARAYLQQVKSDMDAIEAEIVVNGGWGPCAKCSRPFASDRDNIDSNHLIDGKNEAQRKAQLEHALRHHPDYSAAIEARLRAEADLGSAEADTEYAEHAMRGARLSIEYVTALTFKEAAAEGGLLNRERNNHR